MVLAGTQLSSTVQLALSSALAPPVQTEPATKMAGRFQEILSTLASKIPQGGGGPMPKMLGLAGLGATGLAYGGGNMLFNVEGGHRAVMYHRFGGVQERVRGEGTHILLPWFQRPIIYDVRARPRIIQAMTGSHGARSSPSTPTLPPPLPPPPLWHSPPSHLPLQICRW